MSVVVCNPFLIPISLSYQARDALTASPLLGLEATPQPAWYNLSDVFRAWDLFTTAAATQAETQASQAGKGAGEELVESMSYDLVNVGREALATLSNTLFARLNQSSTAKQALERGQLLLALHADADALLCTDAGFSLGQWLTKARGWGNTTDDKDFLESVTRAQPTTWMPACDPTRPLSAEAGGCGSESGLMDYANKQWGGLVSAFYSPRLQCFIDQAEEDLAAGSASLNKTAYYVRLDAQAWAFQRDIGGKRFPICWTPRGDAVQLSRQLIRKYWPTIQP
jgi:alpha-N-acetylglucosaminidase